MPHLYNDQKLKQRRKSLRTDMPQSERVLWYYLKGKHLKNYKFRRQYSIDSYILDFYCPELRLAIEVDGDSHFIDDSAMIRDQKRNIFLAKRNIRVLRIRNSDITKNIDEVVNDILSYLS